MKIVTQTCHDGGLDITLHISGVEMDSLPTRTLSVMRSERWVNCTERMMLLAAMVRVIEGTSAASARPAPSIEGADGAPRPGDGR